MNLLKKTALTVLKLYLFWILLFDFQRILFSIHNFDKFEGLSFGEWLLAFLYSFRVDLAMASFLSILPLLLYILQSIKGGKWGRFLFLGFLTLEMILSIMVHCGEINAYPEWNHKLTTRVFMHLANPDEVVRTADYGMTIWFFVFAFIEFVFGWKLMKVLYKNQFETIQRSIFIRIPLALLSFVLFGGGMFVLARGGVQQIPINTDAAYYSDNHVANDLSVNSVYYFLNSFMLYNRADIEKFIPKMDPSEAEKTVKQLYNYPKEHDRKIFSQTKPNFVFIVLEGWSADVVDCLGEIKGATPNFNHLAKQGILFTNLNACGGTSEIGNSSIFSGYPALPEISISMQPEKHRHLHTINEDLEAMGYTSSYVFSGDLKYGNIGSYFIDHGFDNVEDEEQFDPSLPKGKLNYYDEDLYKKLIGKMNAYKEPFMQCAFTGSTHSPYDHPKKKNQKYVGAEQDYVNSIIYADECIGNFISKCKKQKWYKNTVFVFVADHGHPSPVNPNPSISRYFRIPFLIFGEPVKQAYRGIQIDKIGSQADIAATILYQMGGDLSRYPWSKDLLNPQVTQFALHTINRGFGWISDQGNMTYHMDTKTFFEKTFKPESENQQMKNCHAYLNWFYKSYKELDKKK